MRRAQWETQWGEQVLEQVVATAKAAAVEYYAAAQQELGGVPIDGVVAHVPFILCKWLWVREQLQQLQQLAATAALPAAPQRTNGTLGLWRCQDSRAGGPATRAARTGVARCLACVRWGTTTQPPTSKVLGGSAIRRRPFMTLFKSVMKGGTTYLARLQYKLGFCFENVYA